MNISRISDSTWRGIQHLSFRYVTL
jgi:hypothetical protein